MNSDRQLDLVAEYLGFGYLDRARDHCATVLASEPENVRAHYLMAVIDFTADHLVESFHRAQHVVALAPQWVSGWVLLAKAAWWTRHRDVAVRAAETALALEPQNHQALLTYAEMTRVRHPFRALSVVDQVAADDPEGSDHLRTRALVERRLLRFGRARRALREAVARDPYDVDSMYHMAVTEGRGFRFPRAVRAIFAAAAQHPQSGAKARSYLVFVLVRMLVAIQFVLLVGLLTMTFSSEWVYSPAAPGVHVGPDGVTTTVLPPPSKGEQTRPPSFDLSTLTPLPTFPKIPTLPEFPQIPGQQPPQPPPPGLAPASHALGSAPASHAFGSAPASHAADQLLADVTVRASGAPRFRSWARMLAGLILLGVLATVARTALAVPKSGWPVARETFRAPGVRAQVIVAVIGFVGVAATAVTGNQIGALVAVLPLALGVLVGGYTLVRDL